MASRALATWVFLTNLPHVELLMPLVGLLYTQVTVLLLLVRRRDHVRQPRRQVTGES